MAMEVNKMSAAMPVFLYVLLWCGLETYVGNRDCRYITRLSSYYLKLKNMFKTYACFCLVTYCSIQNNTGDTRNVYI